jgi:hypothetical protein
MNPLTQKASENLDRENLDRENLVISIACGIVFATLVISFLIVTL